MPVASDFFPPVQFNLLWALLALGIVLLIIAWFVALGVLTRAKPVAEPLAPAAPDAGAVQSIYLERIRQVESAHERFELPSRQAHQQLSSLVRAFAHESSIHPASAMTLTELRQVDLPEVAGAVEGMYPAEFGPAERGNVAAAVAEARRVVMEWR